MKIGDVNGLGEKEKEKKDVDARFNTGFHYVGYMLVALAGILSGTMYLARNSISVVMLSMVNRTHLYLVEHPNVSQEVLELHVNRQEDGEFNWSNEMQQAIIGSYMISYTLPQVFAGKLCIKYGPRLVATLSMMLCSIACLATPFFSYLGWEGAMAMRMLHGLGASGTITFVIVVIEIWLPEDQRPIGLAIMQTFSTSFILLCPLVTGYLSEYHWEWGFYFPGAACLMVAITWYTFTRDDPARCSFVSQVELDKIYKSSQDLHKVVQNKEEQMMRERAAQLPWYFMFKIKSFYLFTFLWCCHCTANESLIFLLPTYLAKAFQMTIKDNGLYNFITSAGIFFSTVWPIPLIAIMQNRLKMSLTSSRQVIVFIYSSVCVVTTLYIALYHEQQVLMLAFYRLFHVTNEIIMYATLMSQYGRYGLSGPVFGAMNTFGMLTMAIACWAAGRLLDYTGESYACWSWTFGSFAMLNAVIFLVYFVWLKSKPVRIRELEEASETTRAPV